MANDPQRVRCALHPGRALLRSGDEPAEAPERGRATDAAGAMTDPDGDAAGNDGWGIGFYQGGEVLLQRRPKPPEAPVDFYEIAREVRSDALIGHLRRGTVGVAKNENTHPFRFRSWLFAHHGTVARFEAAKEQLLASVPEHLRRNIRGQTDSEHLFHLFLGNLHHDNKLDDPLISVRMAGKALTDAMATCERISRSVATAGDDTSSTLDLAVTNGRILLVTRYGRPLHVYRVNGVRDCPVCRETPADYPRGQSAADHDHLRAVVLVAAGQPAAARLAPWEEVPEKSLVTVSHELQVEISPLPAM